MLTFAYDKTGNLLTQSTGENQNIESSYNEIGQVTTVTSPEGTITYQYNQQGYLVSVTNGNGDVVSYTYDQYGNKLSMTYPDGRVVSYTYDSMNRMTSVTGLDGEVTTYAYDAAGRRMETASRNLTTEYKYDVVGSLVEQTTTGSSNLSFQYSYNLNGYITGEVRTENGETITSTYAYDPLGELVSFTQSTGYGEQYTYDKVGNMTQKVITPLGSVPNEKGIVENAVTLKMKYNQGNQLVSMANGGDKITYKYDKNGSMVEKALTSKQYGTLTDTYAYNSLDQLVSYTGYDGYQQQFVYDANGMRLSKSEYGNSNRSTLEELLRGEIAGLPEVVEPVAASEDNAAVPAEYEWATTEYLYDITQEYYQVIQQTTTSGNAIATTAYAYGLERIAAYDNTTKTEYIYDGRGSVAQTISAPVAGASVSTALPQVEMQSYAYTAFGEQMGVKVSGFGYNAEDFDAATGMINLRMRQYEPAVSRFCQTDKLFGDKYLPLSNNRYQFCFNSPCEYIDPTGLVTKYGGPYDRGYYHRLVSDDIVSNHQNIVAERGVTKQNGKAGRVDLVDIKTGEVWEIKPMGVSYEKNPERYMRNTTDQLESYLNGRISDTAGSVKEPYIPGGKLAGQFDDPVTNTHITYACSGNGIVWYTVSRQQEKVYVNEPEKEVEHNQVQVPMHYGVSAAPSAGKVVVACLLVLAAVVSPIPGDGVAASGALVSLFAH